RGEMTTEEFLVSGLVMHRSSGTAMGGVSVEAVSNRRRTRHRGAQGRELVLGRARTDANGAFGITAFDDPLVAERICSDRLRSDAAVLVRCEDKRRQVLGHSEVLHSFDRTLQMTATELSELRVERESMEPGPHGDGRNTAVRLSVWAVRVSVSRRR